MEYAVVSGTTEEMDQVVDEYIHSGWTPLGGIAVCPVYDGDRLIVLCYQAMTRGDRFEVVGPVKFYQDTNK